SRQPQGKGWILVQKHLACANRLPIERQIFQVTLSPKIELRCGNRRRIDLDERMNLLKRERFVKGGHRRMRVQNAFKKGRAAACGAGQEGEMWCGDTRFVWKFPGPSLQDIL